MPENRTFVNIEDPNECHWCGARVEDSEEQCFSCGFPQRADEWTQRAWLGKARKEKKNATINMKWARSLLFVMAAYFLVVMLIEYALTKEILVLPIDGALVLIYVFLGIWALKKPFYPLIIGLVLYLLIIVLLAIGNPETILKGIILKVIFIIAFVRSIRFVKNLPQENAHPEDILHD